MIRSLLASTLLIVTAMTAQAQDYPQKPVTLVVPFAPGGSSDVISRFVGQKLSEMWKQSVIVDNKAGGAGQIAMQAVARANPDGYTLILGHIGTLAVNPAMFDKLSYNYKKEFLPVAMLAIVPSAIAVNPDLPIKSVKELLDYAKANPGKLNYGSAGNGSAGHLSMEFFKDTVRMEAQHVPYKGTGPMLTDLLSGQTQLTYNGILPLVPHAKTGKLRIIGVGSPKRLPLMPDVPTIDEQGFPGFETSQWYGVLTPMGTPEAVVKKLNADINKVLADPEIQKRLTDDGAVAGSGSPEDFGKYIDAEEKRWAPVVKKAGIKPD
ncbi:MAG TPA: tripartite tricarboxylate transporter substrate binding protein [Beijerinckiaceae bacterium]|nr:tripartite tricarboxylate transporter substrate binding protein [Beijerinckiaceae bacterium]